MSNKLILDLTVRLTEALDQNYDVVNMDTVLAVISALEGATITKEQLETTRLAKHINQLRRRIDKGNILAIRAKNLLKKWREMFGTTSQIQSEAIVVGSGTSSTTLQATATQQSVPKQALSGLSQPASPITNTQLVGENFDNSLSSIGVDFSRTATNSITTAGCGSGNVNTVSANIKFNKNSVVGAGADSVAIGSRSNGALGKTTNRNITNNSSPATIVNAITTNKVKHPTSFKNLIKGFSVNVSNQANPALSPKILPPIPTNERKLFIIDEDLNQLSSSTTGASGITKTSVVGVSSPRTHKSAKRKERSSQAVMTFLDHSCSPIAFENLSHEQTTMTTGGVSAPNQPSNRNQIIKSTIDLHDSNSSSNFAEVTEVRSNTTTNTGASGKINGGCNSSTAIGVSSKSTSNKRIRKDKKRSNEPVDLVTESEHFQPTIDESSRIAFPISGIQEYLSLSNSSMSIFPAGSGIGVGSGTDRFQSATNEDNQQADFSTERDKSDCDLTFAGKFKMNSVGGFDVESNSIYYKDGGTSTTTAGATRGRNISSIAGGGNGGVVNNNRDLGNPRSAAPTTTSVFLPFSRNSNDSSSNSRTSQLELIDVVNQDSQSMITVDYLRQMHHQKQSSNEKTTPQDIKFSKDAINNTSKQHQYSTKERTMKQQPSLVNSKPSTPNSSLLSMAANANVVSPIVVEQKVPKKRGRKKGSKGVDSVLAQAANLNSQFLMSPALGSNKKVKTTRELLIDIQSRKMGSSATSSPTLMNWFGTSRPASSCSEPSLQSPRTSDANSTNATMSTAARSTPEKNASNNSIAADELYESDSDTNTSEPLHDNVKTNAISKKMYMECESSTNKVGVAVSSIEEQIKEIMAMLPPVDKQKIDSEGYEDIPCTCSLREIPPEVSFPDFEKTENTLEMLENVNAIKNEDDEEPIISVSVRAVPSQQQPVPPLRSLRSPSPNLLHHYSQSAPVSTVTSPVTIKKMGANNQILPVKSIFDLDFDDDNDPLHMFVEAASKTKNGVISHSNSRQENCEKKNKENQKDSKKDIQDSTENEEKDININSHKEKNLLKKPPIPQLQQQTVAPLTHQPEPPDQQMMPLLMNFPTYEVIEDPDCEAKKRYEIQTNQITKFHINAFHNCYIPNVNGNWDHSIPSNNIAGDDECLKLENDSLYANVVPKYGCLVKERIPKDLSYIKFTSNFKPNFNNKKSDKPPPLPFLGVANIHRRNHFRMHQYHKKFMKKEVSKKETRSKDKKTIKKKKTLSKTIHKNKLKEKYVNLKQKSDNVCPEKTEDISNVESIKNLGSFENSAIDINAPIVAEVDNVSVEEEKEIQKSIIENAAVSEMGSNKSVFSEDTFRQEQQDEFPTTENLTTPSQHTGNLEPKTMLTPEVQHSPVHGDENEKLNPSLFIINGNVPHLMNNNSIIKKNDDNVLGAKKKILNNNHNTEPNDVEGIGISRRSSSCSNSSLKQNQNSINLKLRQHRIAHLQLLEKQQKRKRKQKPPLTSDVCEFDADEDGKFIGEEKLLPHKVPPLIKRIKLVNGNYTGEARCPTNSMTDSSYLDDENDSDCYHVHSENDVITEEEDDQEPDDEEDDDDFEGIGGDYDDEDGEIDDEDDDCGDFHEVVTHDMTSSTTGNNHIVLTIKKTPSKTNSPSSSSMSPAPTLIQNLNVNTKISTPTVSDPDFLINEHVENNDNSSSKKLELLELNRVNSVDFFLPESTDVAVYNFQLKKNGDNDHGDDETIENNVPQLAVIADHNGDEEEEQQQHPQENYEENAASNIVLSDQNNPYEVIVRNENAEKSETNDIIDKQYSSIKKEVLTKPELTESIQLTNKYIRRIEMKRRLRNGIERAQKIHRQLFFPYELHSSSGSKILEINSCTSDCTDSSDDETTDSSKSNTELSTSSSSGNGNLKSRVIRLKRKRRAKFAPGKKRLFVTGGDNPPSSSPSSSSSSSSDFSSSASAFTSWTTSDEEDANADKNEKICSKVEFKKEEVNEELKPEEQEQQAELPSGNNFLLRSFNHIYVSTEERKRQQQFKQASEYHNHDVANNGSGGYITLSGDDSKDELITLLQEQPNERYISYFEQNSRHETCRSLPTSTKKKRLDNTSSPPKQKPISQTATITMNSMDVEIIEQPSQVGLDEDDEEREENKPSTVIIEPLTDEIKPARTKKNSNNHISSDVDSININYIKNESVQMHYKSDLLESIKTENDRTEDKNNDENIEEENNMVAQEEYRTGIRRVDEDVVDEDGNNCARTQQFKEWHEVLQLRSYNDELLTVLPYVVIE